MKRQRLRNRMLALLLATTLATGLVPARAMAEVSPLAEGQKEQPELSYSPSDEDTVAQIAKTAPLNAGVMFATPEDGEKAAIGSEPESATPAPADVPETTETSAHVLGSSEGEGVGNDAEANTGEEPAESLNPFKAGIEAQQLANLENYYGRNHDEEFKAKAWKTSVGCTGKKRWIGSVRNDDGFFAPGVEEPSLDYSGPTVSEYDAEIYAYVEKNYECTVDGETRDVVFVYGDCGLSSVDFSQIFDGSYDVYIPFYAFKDTDISAIAFPSFVKELGAESFYCYLSQGLSSIQFETDEQGNGIQRICGGAFTNNENLSTQEQIVIPRSIKYLEGNVFGEYDGAVNVLVKNPDVRFGDEYTDENDVDNPFGGGGMVSAYRFKSDGVTPSDAMRLSQKGTGNITWNWIDTATLRGTLLLPAGMTVDNVQITVVQGDETLPVTPDADKTFVCDRLIANAEAQVTISAAGYYEKTYFRIPQDMTSNIWDMGTIDISAFTPIPAQQTFPLDVRYDTGRTDSQGNPVLADNLDWNKLSFKLFQGGTEIPCGTLNDDETMSGDWVTQNGMLVLSEALAQSEGVPENLTLEITRSGAKGAANATATFNAETNAFAATFESWGTIRVTTQGEASSEDAFAGQARVIVFAGTNDAARKVADACTIPTPTSSEGGGAEEGANDIWQLVTDQLEPGTYTVVAFDAAAPKPTVSSLLDTKSWSFPFAKTQITVENGKQAAVELTVPLFSTEDLLKTLGIKSITPRVKSDTVCVGCETILSLDYELTSAKGATLVLGGFDPEIEWSVSVSDDDQYPDWSITSDGLNISLPANKTSGTISVAFRPNKEQVYNIPITFKTSTMTAQVSSLSFAALGVQLKMDTNFVSQGNNSATVYAQPGSTLELYANETKLNLPEQQTNNLGRATIPFDLPSEATQNLLYGDSVQIKVVASYYGNSYESFVSCTYRPSAELWTFKVTNDGQTQTLIEDGQQQETYLTIHYQIPRKRNAYWTFDITVKNAGQEINAKEKLMLFATLEDGRTETVVLTKQPQSDEGYTRFVGEYVDEAYLELLKNHNSNSMFSNVLLFASGLFIPKSYSMSAYQLAFTVDLNDEDYKNRLVQRAQEEAAKNYTWLQELLWSNDVVDEMVSEEAQQICSDTKDVLEGLAGTLRAEKDNEELSEEDQAALDDAIAEIEALMPNFSDPTRMFEDIDIDAWMRTVEAELFAGTYPEPVSYTAPSVDEITDWYGDDTQAAKNAKAFFDAVETAVSANNAATQRAARATKNAAEKTGSMLDVGSPSAAGTPSALLDKNLEEKGELAVKENPSTPAGDAELTTTDGNFTVDLYVSDKQKADGKYYGYTAVVTEQPPAAAQDQGPRITSYTPNFLDKWQYSLGAMKDTYEWARFTAAGMILDSLVESEEAVVSTSLSATTQSAAGTAASNVANASKKVSLAKDPLKFKANLKKTTDAAQAVASSQEQAVKTSAKSNWVSKNLNDLATWMPILGTAANAYGTYKACDSWFNISDTLGLLDADIEDINRWILFWKQKNPCESECKRCLDALYAERDAAEELKEILQVEEAHSYADAQWSIISLHVGAAASILSMGTCDPASAGAQKIGQVAGNVVSKAGLAVDVSSNATHLYRAPWIDVANNKYLEATEYRKSVCKETAKDKEDDENAATGSTSSTGSNRTGKNGKHSMDASIIVDPSGTIYEALETNPVQGATASVWTRGKDAPSDEQGTLWNAAAYEQVNPQITGTDGAFAWDTPTGQYQVHVEKEGYEQASTAWLPVLPIQSGLKISLKSTEDPTVAYLWADPEYIEVAFDQYMKANADVVAKIDNTAAARVEWVDVQQASEADGYGALSRVLRVYPATQLEEHNMITFALQGAQNYVGRTLGANGTDTWTTQAVVNRRPATLVTNYENAVVMRENSAQDTTVMVYTRFSDGTPAANQIIVANMESIDIAAFTRGSSDAGSVKGETSITLITNEEGKATFGVSGKLPGLTTLTLSVPGTTLVKELPVRVTSDAAQPARPVAVIDGQEFGALSPKENSATVACGSTLEITCATEGATIYYTTDNTCPCKPEGTRIEYTGPITVTKDTKFRITAYKEGMSYDSCSERLNLSTTVVYERGDVSGNGVVNVVDAQIAYDIATTDSYKDRADYDQLFERADVVGAGGAPDGQVYAEDAFAIQHAALCGWGRA